MVRRLVISVALVTGLIVIAAAGMIAFRIALAEAVLSSRLASLGIPEPRLTVAALDFRRMIITDVALGREGELHVDTVTLTYRAGALLAGRLENIAIDGIRLRLDLSGAGPPLGSLQPLLQPGQGGGGSGAGAMPAEITLSRGRIEAAAAAGDMSANVSGRWRPMEGKAALLVSDFALPHLTLDAASLEVDATPDRIVLAAVAHGSHDAFDLDLRATIESWRHDPTLALAFEGSLVPAAWRIPPLPAVTEGGMAMSAQIEGRLPPMQQLSPDANALTWFLGADLSGRLQTSLSGISWRDRAEGISGTLNLAVTVADGDLGIALADEGRIQSARLDPAVLDAIGVAAVMPRLRDAEITLALPARDQPLHMRLRPTAEGADLTVSGAADVTMAETALELRADGTLALDKAFAVQRIAFPRADMRLRELTLADGHRLRQLHVTGAIDGPPTDLAGAADLTVELGATRIETVATGAAKMNLAADFRWAGQRLDVRQRGDGVASVASLGLGKVARIAKSFSLRLTDGEAALDIRPDGLALSHAITIQVGPVTVHLPRPDMAPLALQAEAGTIRLEGDSHPDAPYRGRLTLARSRFAIPDQALSAEAVTASIAFPAVAERLAQFTIGRLLHTGEPAAFAALGVDGEIGQQEDMLVLRATGTGAGGRVRFTIGGRHRISDGRGTLQIRVPEMTFGKGALQPAHLSPLLRDIRDATGRIGATAEFAWGTDGVRSKGALDISNISFSTDTVTVAGLDTQISLDGLLPPSTPPDQELTVRRIDPVLPVQDVAARFQIEAGEPPRLRLKEAKGGFAGGRLSVADVVLDASRPHNNFGVAVDRIDLRVLLSLLNVEDVSATGWLSGTIPVTVADGSVIINNGLLAADGPGVLRIQSKAASTAFRGTGEQITLMLKALEDFHYEALSATLDISVDGAAAAMIRMQGNNPAVLEGYPFAFNIGLSGKIAELLAAMRQGAEISTDLVRPKLR